MKTTKLKLAQIGNSRGVRLPAASLRRYRMGDEVIMEERAEGILLRPDEESLPKLSWAETAREMAKSGEDWSVWESTASDGLESAPWETREQKHVAEPKTRYRAGSRRASNKK